MKSELNDYKITNADGIIKSSNDGKITYNNENPHYIEENSLSVQDENFNENETFDSDEKDETKNQNTSNDANSSQNLTSTTASTASSTASTVSGGLGSLVGGVVSSVATAVIVVAAFVSMLTINIALVMAGTNSLVFQLEMIGAQKEDFENKTYYAILEGDDYLQTQEIFMDSVYITFEDLEPGKEYIITIRNDEKIFVSKSYFTATEDIQRGFLEVSSEENTVYAYVGFRALNPNEFYTFTATDSKGNVLFRDSDVKPEKEYCFDIKKPDTIACTLSIDGKVCCFEQYFVEFETIDDDEPTDDEHEHNYIPSGFVWDYDNQGNLIAFGEGVCETCEDVLTIPAQITKDGDMVVASITYNGTTYTDKRVEIDLTGKENVISQDSCYFIKATNYVLGNIDSENTIRYNNDSEHPYTIKGTADEILNCINIYNSGLSIPNVGYRSDYYFEFNNLSVSANSNSNSTIFNVQTKYDVTIHITIRGNVNFTTNNAPSFIVENTGENDVSVTFDINYLNQNSNFSCYDEYNEQTYFFDAQSGINVIFNINGVQVDANGDAIVPDEPDEYEDEYDFEEGTWSWSNDYLTAYLSFPEIHGGEPLILETFVQEMETPATCEQEGSIVYTASIYVEQADEVFSDEQTVILQPIGHDYGEPVFEWSQGVTGAPTATATFTCSNDSSHQMVLTADVSESYAQDQTLQYIATVTYNNVTYEDIYEVDPIIEGVEIDLNEGQLYINASGYARQESGLSNPTEFISSEANPYLIQNQNINWCDNIINVYQTDSSIQTADIYIKLKNVTIEAGSWCSLFRIMAKNTLNIHLIIEGNVTFVGGSGQQIFSSQGSNSPTVNIIIDQTSVGGTFSAEATDGLTYAQSGSIDVRYV